MIENNLKIVFEKIHDSVEKSKRNFGDIRIVAISKTNPISSILEGLKVGITNFGENKAIEFRDKSKLIIADLVWHFVGHLQRNKVKYVINAAEYIHSVESFKLAEEINKRAKTIGKVQNIFFEVNTSNEESKFGLSNYDELCELVKRCEELSNIQMCGLMTMASFTSNETELRKNFSSLREMRDKINNKTKSISELSMGMTNDYPIAIEEGATILRIGTAIFGKRDTSLTWSEK
ncbi:MAG: YggS family pyridoxal phosphate-dependent enzyme [Melioribacteraceae bacterium]|nr:YggS family pyridoxal phosphate-dependent enzyme [Melioribacteraceae bacterium]